MKLLMKAECRNLFYSIKVIMMWKKLVFIGHYVPDILQSLPQLFQYHWEMGRISQDRVEKMLRETDILLAKFKANLDLSHSKSPLFPPSQKASIP